MKVWRAFEVGVGKCLPWSRVRDQQSGNLLPQLNKLADNESSEVSFQVVKVRRQAKQKQDFEKASSKENESDNESCEKERELFFCPVERNVKSFQQFSSLEKHLDCGKHEYALEQETLYDKAMTMCTAKLEHGAGVVPETVDEDSYQSFADGGSTLMMGWALKSATLKRKNFTANQKAYLTEVFLAGERSSQKADPPSTLKAMRRAKHEDGSRIFNKSDYLTPLQISVLFCFFSPYRRKKLTQLKNLTMKMLTCMMNRRRKQSTIHKRLQTMQ